MLFAWYAWISRALAVDVNDPGNRGVQEPLDTGEAHRIMRAVNDNPYLAALKVECPEGVPQWHVRGGKFKRDLVLFSRVVQRFART